MVSRGQPGGIGAHSQLQTRNLPSYWYCVLVGLFLAMEPGGSELVPFFVAIVALPGLFVAAALVYRMWKAIRDEQTRPTPGMAVLGLAIPVFNLYWTFRVWAGWPVAYGAYAQRAGKDVPQITPAPFTAMVILVYLAPVIAVVAIPFMG